MARFVWKGDEILAKAAQASAVGIDKTMSDCVSDAKREHPYEDQTGAETGSVRMNAAKVEGLHVSGTWGAYTDYSLFLEIGTSRIGQTAEEREAEGHGDMWAIPDVRPGLDVPVLQDFTIVPLGDGEFITEHRPSVRHGNPGLIAPRPFLRPAADHNYGKLRGYIAAAFRASS